MKEIQEDEIEYHDPEEIEICFNNLEEGDTVTIHAKGDNYIIGEIDVKDTHHSRGEDDNVVFGNLVENGIHVELRQKWYPKEPNVGIPKPYSEGPITFKKGEEKYEVTALFLKE